MHMNYISSLLILSQSLNNTLAGLYCEELSHCEVHGLNPSISRENSFAVLTTISTKRSPKIIQVKFFENFGENFGHILLKNSGKNQEASKLQSGKKTSADQKIHFDQFSFFCLFLSICSNECQIFQQLDGDKNTENENTNFFPADKSRNQEGDATAVVLSVTAVVVAVAAVAVVAVIAAVSVDDVVVVAKQSLSKISG